MLKTLRRRLRRGEAGQSIVILALGFLGLLAFVGLTTDFSLLYVRYSTLRRAVDSAAIAAAGQVRQDRTLGEVGLAARQFIEFHNLNPREVLIDTCQNSPDMDTTTAGVIVDPVAGIDERDPELCTVDLRKIVRVTAVVESPTVFLRIFGLPNFELRASALSETAVLDVVLVMDVSESMLNETNVADWAQVGQAVAYVPPRIGFDWPLNVMNPETVFERLMAPIGGLYSTDPRYDPSLNDNADLYAERLWQAELLAPPQEAVNRRITYLDRSTHPETPALLAAANGPGATGDESTAYIAYSFVPNQGATARDRAGNQIPTNQVHMRSACRVRFWPYSLGISLSPYQRQLYNDHGIDDFRATNRWDGFVPAYNFYGCCNDPMTGGVIFYPADGSSEGVIQLPGGGINTAPDGDFSDLVCEPMKSARDAVRQFLDRLDFQRGDRVGMVTFDRSAFLIDPDGRIGPDPNGNGVTDANEPNLYHMMEDVQIARNALDTYIGVRAEPNFYIWNDRGGGWAANIFAQGLDEQGYSLPIDFYTPFDGPNTGQYGNPAPSPAAIEATRAINYNDYPVKDSCPFFNAALFYPYSRYALRSRVWDSMTDLSGLWHVVDGLARSSPSLYQVMTPDILNEQVTWGLGYDLGGVDAVRSPDLNYLNSYELWSSCRGTNIGAGLRTAYNGLTDASDPRRDNAGGSDLGVVQIVIVLSDGAAGATDPTRRAGELPAPALPYALTTDTYEVDLVNGERSFGVRGQYGAYGLCPYGDPSRPAELVDTANEPSVTFPFCSDELPQTRHFCYPPNRQDTPPNVTGFSPGSRDTAGRLYDIDLGVNYPNSGANCDPYYDVDDYARDWADFVTCAVGSRYEGAAQCGDVIPTIFTIGFGLQFPNGGGTCTENIPDCLGEELLRYIADAGDNFRIDNDYQQDWLDNGLLDNSVPEVSAGNVTGYDEPGVCERAGGSYVPRPANPNPADIVLLNPGVSCGNYFNAPGGRELDIVFDEIASRMFTRLSQ